MLTDEETGPSCDDVPFAVKLTPLGAFSLTSRAAAHASVELRETQLVFLTCGIVVEVLVDELENIIISSCVNLDLYIGSQNIRRWRALRCH